MKDILQQELEDGDLILHIRDGCIPIIGVIIGGTTPTGKIRYINARGKKCHAMRYSIVKTNREQIQPQLDYDLHRIMTYGTNREVRATNFNESVAELFRIHESYKK